MGVLDADEIVTRPVRARWCFMDINERHVGSVTILDLKGRLVCEDGDRALMDAVNAVVKRGELQVLINLEGVPWIDSAGIGALVAKFVTVRKRGGSLKLVNLKARTEQPLRVTRLMTIFETFDSEADALRSFEKSEP
jgi:anti-sigma B factor antagonist